MTASEQIDILAQTILEVCPGEIRDEGAGECAARLLRQFYALPPPPTAPLGDALREAYHRWRDDQDGNEHIEVLHEQAFYAGAALASTPAPITAEILPGAFHVEGFDGAAGPAHVAETLPTPAPSGDLRARLKAAIDRETMNWIQSDLNRPFKLLDCIMDVLAETPPATPAPKDALRNETIRILEAICSTCTSAHGTDADRFKRITRWSRSLIKDLAPEDAPTGFADFTPPALGGPGTALSVEAIQAERKRWQTTNPDAPAAPTGGA